MSTRLKTYWMMLAAAVLLLPTLSFAQDATYSTTTPLTGAGFSNGFSLPAFDSNLGSLQTITLSYSISASGSIDVSNSDSSGMSGGGGTINSANLLYSPNVGLGRGPGVIIINVGVGGTPPAGDSVETGTELVTGNLSIDPSTYAAWESPGGGTLSLTLTAQNPSFTGGGSPSITYGANSLAESGSFTIDYTYIAVPEPSTCALLLSGLVALGAYGYCRQRAA